MDPRTRSSRHFGRTGRIATRRLRVTVKLLLTTRWKLLATHDERPAWRRLRRSLTDTHDHKRGRNPRRSMQHEHALQPRATADANAALHLTIMLQCTVARLGSDRNPGPLIHKATRTEGPTRHMQDSRAKHPCSTQRARGTSDKTRSCRAKCTKGGKRRAAPPQAGLRKALRAVFRSGAPGRWGGCLGQAINDLDPLGLGHLRRANRVGGQESSPLGKADANSTGFVELTWSKPSCRLGQILDQ